MIDGQFFTAGATAAVLTHKSITLKHIATAECHDAYWQAIIASECDDLWNSQAHPLRADDGVSFGRCQLGPVFPGVQLKTGGVNNSSRLVPDLDQRTRDC